jgi:PIN domain nuclease of toxin-antitoxin system
MSDLLLDTCALLWLAEGKELSSESRAAIVESDLHVSPITVWEIANLSRKNRIVLAAPVAAWFRQALQKMRAQLHELSIDVLANSCLLPGTPPDDPADRIIIATAREVGLPIVTRDRAILAYSNAGYVRTLAC